MALELYKKSWSSWRKTSANYIDIAFAVDVGIAGDTPGVTSKEAKVKWAMNTNHFI